MQAPIRRTVGVSDCGSAAMTALIVPTTPCHFEGLRLTLDSVAREQRYLAFLRAPAKDEAYAFFQNIVDHDLCQFVAIQDDTVVGWCDVLPTHGEARAHIGILGIGLLPRARHQGLGASLMSATIGKAWEKNLSRIELSVRTDNINAKALYARFGFVVEGLQPRAFCVDGKFFDAYAMALLR